MIKWKKGKQLSLFHVYLYKLMKDKTHPGIAITYSQIKEVFNRTIHNVPRIYYIHLLNEMEEANIIKKIGNKKNFKYQLLEKDLEKILIKYNTIF